MRLHEALTLWRCAGLIGLTGRIVPCQRDYCLIFDRPITVAESVWVGSALRFALGEPPLGPE